MWFDVAMDDSQTVEVIEAIGQLVQSARDISVDLVDKATLRFSKIFARSAIPEKIEETGLAHFDSNVQEVLVLLVVKVTDDVRVQVALLEELDFLLGQSKVLG